MPLKKKKKKNPLIVDSWSTWWDKRGRAGGGTASSDDLCLLIEISANQSVTAVYSLRGHKVSQFHLAATGRLVTPLQMIERIKLTRGKKKKIVKQSLLLKICKITLQLISEAQEGKNESTVAKWWQMFRWVTQRDSGWIKSSASTRRILKWHISSSLWRNKEPNKQTDERKSSVFVWYWMTVESLLHQQLIQLDCVHN